jgi:L-lactate dehydrogenase
LKGGAGFAVGISIREVVHSVALGQDRILPVSSLVSGPYGLRDVCISVPTVVGRKGVLEHLEIELWPKEISALQHSAQVLRETIEAVMKSNKNAAAKPAGSVAAPGAKPAAANHSAQRPPRVTIGSAGGNTRAGHSRVTVSGQSKGNR